MFPRRIQHPATALLLCGAICSAQQQATSSAAQQPQFSPKAAYDDAMHPLDETRRAISNWSGAELAALTVTLSRARSACKARDPHAYAGADLIEITRLCALGQEWGLVVLSSGLYIDESAVAKPQLAEAHAARVDADLHLRSEADALRDAHTMLAAVPYTAIVAEASTEAIEYMRFSAPEDAIALASEREPFVLQQIRAAGTIPASVTASSTAAPQIVSPPASVPPKLSAHELYVQGIALASLLQQANRPALAQNALVELEKALPAALPADDTLRIAEDRRRYDLLGKPLPALSLTRSLSMPNILPAIPAVNTVTALLLFPDWCAQCIASMSQLPETVSAVEGHSAYYYGLLAETVPEKAPSSQQTSAEMMNSFQPGYAAFLLSERPVITVAASTENLLAANDYPYLVMTDSKGIVRVAQPIDADDLLSGGKVDSAVLMISQHWPLPVPPALQQPAVGAEKLATGKGAPD